MKVGVLALQGDFREHLEAVKKAGHAALTVRRIDELDEVDALILPGGESTSIAHLAEVFGLFQPIQRRIAAGMPIYGSCAGMILLANEIIDGVVGQKTFGGMKVKVRRNAFGRQVESFEEEINFAGDRIHAVFIRAPWVEDIDPAVTTLSSIVDRQGITHPVAIRQGNLLATSFHPELTAHSRIHSYFFDEICAKAIK